MIAVSASLAERYTGGHLLGAGAGGAVYLAQDNATGEAVAMKCFHATPGRPRPGLREFSVLLPLRHPRIAACLDFFYLENGDCALVCEYAGPVSLRDLINERPGPWPADEATAVIAQVLEGLAYLHPRGVIHCDLKPENILVDRDAGGEPVCKLVDFGIARLRRAAPAGGANVVAGTPAYLAPEAACDQFAAAADLYSTGIILYELLAGRRPFEGLPREVLRQQLAAPPDFALITDPGLRRLLARLLAKDPGQRPATAVLALAELHGYVTIETWPPTRPCEPKSKTAGEAGGALDLLAGFTREKIGGCSLPGETRGVHLLNISGRPVLALDHGSHFELVDALSGRPLPVLRAKSPAPLVVLGSASLAYAATGGIRRWSAQAGEAADECLHDDGGDCARFRLGNDGRQALWVRGARLAAHDRATGRAFTVPLREAGLGSAFGARPGGGAWCAGGVVDPVCRYYGDTGEVTLEERLPGVVAQVSPWAEGPAFFATRIDRGGWKAGLHAVGETGVLSRYLEGNRATAFAFPQGGVLTLGGDGGWTLHDRKLEPVGTLPGSAGATQLEFSADNFYCTEITRSGEKLTLATYQNHVR